MCFARIECGLSIFNIFFFIRNIFLSNLNRKLYYNLINEQKIKSSVKFQEKLPKSYIKAVTEVNKNI